MTAAFDSRYEPWDEARGAGIIAEHASQEGATLVILHALQEAFGYVPEPAIPDGGPGAEPVSRRRSTASSRSIMISATNRPAAMC